MPIVVGREGYERTLLQCVQNIVVGIGEPKPSSIDTGRETHMTAVLAVNNAQLYISSVAQWDFMFGWGVIDLVTTSMWYPLPYDFGEMATHMPVYLGTEQVTYLDFRDLLAKYPDFRAFPPGAGTNLTVTVQAAQNTNHFGSPEIYTVTGTQIGLFPIPDEDYVDTQNQAVYGYYAVPPDLISEGDLIELKKELWPALHWFSLAYLKQYLEYPDWQADEARGERALQGQIIRITSRQIEDLNFEQDLVRE